MVKKTLAKELDVILTERTALQVLRNLIIRSLYEREGGVSNNERGLEIFELFEAEKINQLDKRQREIEDKNE